MTGSTLQRATWRASKAGPRVLHTFTLAYMVAWARRSRGLCAEYVAAHGEHVTLEGASVCGEYGAGLRVNSGWQGIDWSAEPVGDNSAIYR